MFKLNPLVSLLGGSLAIGAVAFALFKFSPAGKPHAPEADALPVDIPLQAAQVDTSQTHILIDKSDYLLTLFEGDSLLKTYPVVFGRNPVDDKQRQGDACTPEGIFHVRSKYPHARWSRFIWVDYPNERSWEKFKAAQASGTVSANAIIGGDIGIHGVPEGRDDLIPDRQNWTLGCISLTNAHVQELYSLLPEGAQIEIRK